MTVIASLILALVLATVIAAGMLLGRRNRRTLAAGPAVADSSQKQFGGFSWWPGRGRKEAERKAAEQARIDSLERTIAYYDQRLSQGAESEFFVRWATEQRCLAEQELERLKIA